MRTEYARLLGLQSLLGLQGAIVIIGTIITYVIVTPPAAKSFAYGSLVSLIGALYLAWRLKQGERQLDVDAGQVLRNAYKTVIERFVWAALMLGLGFKLLELTPLWLLAGFVVGQAAWLLVPVWIRLRTQNDD